MGFCFLNRNPEVFQSPRVKFELVTIGLSKKLLTFLTDLSHFRNDHMPAKSIE